MAFFVLFGMLFPLSLYLLTLGLLNRRRTPVLVPGVWDGLGLLCGVSGFLLIAGPKILFHFNERIRMNWLASSNTTALNPGQVEVLLAVLYLLAVVAIVAYLFARQRHLTCLYNADLEEVEQILVEIFAELKLDPLRSGQVFFFRSVEPNGTPETAPVLEIEPFEAFRHVTLRWDPSNPSVRVPVERELARHLAATPTGPNEVSFWLLLSGVFLFGMSCMGLGVALVLYLR